MDDVDQKEGTKSLPATPDLKEESGEPKINQPEAQPTDPLLPEQIIAENNSNFPKVKTVIGKINTIADQEYRVKVTKGPTNRPAA